MSKVSYWLNVDIPTSKCTVHTTDCLIKPRRSGFKGVRFLDRDGGWMPFSDIPSFIKYWRSLGGYALHYCRICWPSARALDGEKNEHF